MAWYDLGTVKVTANSKAVTGTGTKWLTGARQGEAFVAPDGRLYEVLSIASDTSLTLTKPYRGATATGQSYALAPIQGYVKELADRAAGLLPVLADLGTAAKATLTDSNQDATAGRVARIGDWGFGVGSSIAADPNILNNTVNGFYRSGSGSTEAPDNNTGAGYIKFGWSGAYYSLLYASPISDKLWIRNVQNRIAKPWQELLTHRNTMVDSNGFIKKASPVIQLGSTGIEKTMHPEIAAAKFERLGAGHYLLRQVPLLSRDGWYIETPKDRNGNVYFTLDYEECEQDQTLTIRTYEPDYSTGPAINGKALDILPDRFVSLRFAEEPSPALQDCDPVEYPAA